MASTQTQSEWTRPELNRLLNLTAILADLTTSFALLDRIPAFLAEQLQCPAALMAVVYFREGTPEFIQFAATGAYAETTKLEPSRQRALQECQHASTANPGDSPASKSISYNPDTGEVVLCRDIDPLHKLVLVLTHRGPASPTSAFLFTVDLVGTHLAAQLAAMIAWMADVSVLGSPFDRLTEREWVVLQGLQSEDGEKQVADRLALSPHTLHSHIKSIYRKLGVQGRLPVLIRLGAAQRALRMRMVATHLLPD